MKPILFNTEMVRAILDGRKTVTQRVVKPQPNREQRLEYCEPRKEWTLMRGWALVDKVINPPYRPGDIMYVRETWRIWKAHRYDADAHIEFKSGGEGTVLRFPNGGTDSTKGMGHRVRADQQRGG